MQHGQGLGQHSCVHQKALGLRPATGGQAQAHRFCRGSAFIEERGVGDRQASELTDQGLKIEQGFQATLSDFSLVGRVGRVPRGVFEHLTLNDRWRHGVVVTKTNQRSPELIGVSQATQLRQSTGFRTPSGKVLNRRKCIKNIGRNNRTQKGIEILKSQRLQHPLLRLIPGSDMPAHEWRQGLCHRRVRHTLFKQGQKAGCGEGDCKEVPAALTA